MHSYLKKIDGTHGTNGRNWHLTTTVLIKDENNMGFPIAFLLSNRLGQVIQEHFFRALQIRLRESVEAEYIMSDDILNITMLGPKLCVLLLHHEDSFVQGTLLRTGTFEDYPR
ncbi:hypothetical protein NQ315_013533 [Exocentrus adspersus]|uniref:MULE transposase domain-containing protein n=1 Tax=Exocentrus adspersus TaxID=1586481 RepID=A0AAV8VBU1_9CUCU|nr:hypothetical protein NQ315_013533 [Exocentrus adspersus]